LFFLPPFSPSVKAKEDWSAAFPFSAFNFATPLNAQQMCRSWESTFHIWDRSDFFLDAWKR
jgi:hypothetical protein